MQRFSWQLATVKELAEELKNINPSRLGRQIHHYKATDNVLMLSRIDKAKKILRYWQILNEAEKLKKEIQGYL